MGHQGNMENYFGIEEAKWEGKKSNERLFVLTFFMLDIWGENSI